MAIPVRCIVQSPCLEESYANESSSDLVLVFVLRPRNPMDESEDKDEDDEENGLHDPSV